MNELLYLVACGFLPTFLVGWSLKALPRTRASAFRGSRLVSLAITVLPLIIVFAAVQENTADSPDEGFATFLGAFLFFPVVTGSWLATLTLSRSSSART